MTRTTSLESRQLDLARRGDRGDQFNIALAYQDGIDIPQDYEKAIFWYRKAAYQGHAVAQYNLGLLLKQGLGCSGDKAKAGAWFRMAAEQGHQAAQFDLATLFESGEGVPKNLVMAYVWFALACVNSTHGLYGQSVATAVPGFRESPNAIDYAAVADGNRNRLWVLLGRQERVFANLLSEEYYIKHLLPFR